MTEEELVAEVVRLRRDVDALARTLARFANHFFGSQIESMIGNFEAALATGEKYQRVFPDQAPSVPLRLPEDSLPRGGRNPRIFCEQHESGTWIHGRPHNCPPWARR